MAERALDSTESEVTLRDVHRADLPLFFEQQLDPEANYMAAFTAGDQADREAFMARWLRILAAKNNFTRTILFEGQVAGYLAHFDQFGKPAVSYWLGKAFWGQGIATRALQAFLEQVTTRPLYARAVKDNVASIRVLQKCGFTICGEAQGFSNVRKSQVEEYILELR